MVYHYSSMYFIQERKKYFMLTKPFVKRPFDKGMKKINDFLKDDVAAIEQIRMDKRTFYILCGMLRTMVGLKDTKNMLVEEMVALFLNILGHDTRNMMIKNTRRRSQETISRLFHKNCLGALDGTYMKLRLPEGAKTKYRTRKGELATNVLLVCTRDMQFVYALPGWEGSAANSRILRDAISRRNALKIPNGYYYLVDTGYTNGNGLLAPYRGQRYHLNEWREGRQPVTKKEFFNMKHSAPRNIIEKCIGLLKMREMRFDPIEAQLDTEFGQAFLNDYEHGEHIGIVEPSNEWTAWRDQLANEMFNTWRANREYFICTELYDNHADLAMK
ncbi:uncharacterized protein LOC120005978 [Tripterygium wilfordii]|uniref:uncharacterized protein LOC120005978 n=1 Tax=Tripterygium wilfordii TaxID=458696 RepID=UPI0018F8481D|nr:uncharacterized protein LOC120005978 [Tripterygium wilfordii]